MLHVAEIRPQSQMERALELTSRLDRWDATLKDGTSLTIWAHAVSEDADNYVFKALMRGDPHFEIDVARIPTTVVADLIGG